MASRSNQPTIIAVFIAYNASETLRDFYTSFPMHLVDEVILVDDASTDGTYELACQLGIPAYQNLKNLGYGGNIKRALELALGAGGDIIVDIHPDGEYMPTAIEPALGKIKNGAKLVLGRRFDNILEMLNRGMHSWKVYPLVVIDLLPRIILSSQLKDYHQGFRIYTREMLEQINWRTNSDGYIFSFQVICQTIFRKLPIEQVPVETLYSGEKRGASIKHSVSYTLGTLKVLILYILAKWSWRSRMFQDP